MKEAFDAALASYAPLENDTNLPKAIHGAGWGLFVAREALVAAIDANANSSPGLWERCRDNVYRSERVFSTVATGPAENRVERYKEYVREQEHGRAVEDIVKKVMVDLFAFTNDHNLSLAIEKLERMESSIPTESRGDTFNNWGTGDQLNAPGGEVKKNEFSGSSMFSGSGTYNF